MGSKYQFLHLHASYTKQIQFIRFNNKQKRILKLTFRSIFLEKIIFHFE